MATHSAPQFLAIKSVHLKLKVSRLMPPSHPGPWTTHYFNNPTLTNNTTIGLIIIIIMSVQYVRLTYMQWAEYDILAAKLLLTCFISLAGHGLVVAILASINYNYIASINSAWLSTSILLNWQLQALQLPPTTVEYIANVTQINSWL